MFVRCSLSIELYFRWIVYHFKLMTMVALVAFSTAPRDQTSLTMDFMDSVASKIVSGLNN